MNRRTWLFLAAALVAISALATWGTVANASLPTDTAHSNAQSIPVSQQAQPKGLDGDWAVDCSKIDALGIKKQMNMRATLAMQNCGRGGEVQPPQAVKGSGGDFS